MSKGGKAQTANELMRYVPYMVQQHYEETGKRLEEPIIEEFSGCVVMVDVSGFTKLSAWLNSQGSDGPERLSKYLNEYFGRMISIIRPMGGDVQKFAGDAIQVLWRSPKGDTKALAEVTYTGAVCACKLMQQLNKYAVAGSDITLEMHIAVTAGQVFGLHVGDPKRNRWEYLIAGDALTQTALVVDATKKSEVGASFEAWEYIKEDFKGERRQDFVLITLDPPYGGATPHSGVVAKPLPTVADPAALFNLVEGYAPPIVAARLRESGGLGWLAESRRVTVLFTSIPSLKFESAASLGPAQNAMAITQNILARFEGTLRQYIVDDKGTVIICCFGLPPFAHENDAVFGVKAACLLRKELSKSYEEFSIGVTTGEVFAGAVGNDDRCEYAVMGDVVNMSARLMASKPAKRNVVVDEATYLGAKGTYKLDALEPIKVKGKDEPMPVWRPIELNKDKSKANKTNFEAAIDGSIFVGRQKERQVLDGLITNLQVDKAPSLFLMEGEGGIGKSAFIQLQVSQCVQKGMGVVYGECLDIEKNSPYYAWNEIFSQVMELPDTREGVKQSGQSPAALRTGGPSLSALNAASKPSLPGDNPLEDKVKAYMARFPDLVPLLPLMNHVLDVDFKETAQTANMEGILRAGKTVDLLATILSRQAHLTPLVVILDDVQWLDMQSWELVQRIGVSRVPGLMLSLYTRPMKQEIGYEPEAWVTVKDVEHANHIVLKPFGTNETSEMLMRHFKGSKEVSQELVRVLVDRSSGNCLFLEQIIKVLKEDNRVEIRDEILGIKSVPGEELDLTLAIPNSMNGIVVSRFDKLPQKEQVILKSASIIGRVFQCGVLSNILGEEVTEDDVVSCLQKVDLVSQLSNNEDGDGTEVVFIFQSDVIRSVVYGLLLVQKRSELHLMVAEFLETKRFPTPWSVVALHYNETDNTKKIIEANDQAAESSMSSFAIQDAIKSFEKAELAWKSQSKKKEDAASRARIEKMGMCYGMVTNYNKCREYIEKALKNAGRKTVGGGKLPTLFNLVKQVIKQKKIQKKKKKGKLAFLPFGEQYDRDLKTARMIIQLQEAVFFLNDKLSYAYYILNTMNLLEPLGNVSELGCMYSKWGFIMHVKQKNKKRDAYMCLSDEVTENAPLNPAYEAYSELFRIIISASKLDILGARKHMDLCKQYADAIGENTRRAQGLVITAFTYIMDGEFDKATEMMMDTYLSARDRGDIMIVLWYTSTMTISKTTRKEQVMGSFEMMKDSVGLVLKQLDETADMPTVYMVYSAWACAKARMGMPYLDILNLLQKGATFVDKMEPPNFVPCPGMYCVAICIATLWWQSVSEGFEIDSKELQRILKKTIVTNKKFTVIFPFLGNLIGFMEGLYCLVGKQWKKARKFLAHARLPTNEAKGIYSGFQITYLSMFLDGCSYKYQKLASTSKRDSIKKIAAPPQYSKLMDEARELMKRSDSTYALTMQQVEEGTIRKVVIPGAEEKK